VTAEAVDGVVVAYARPPRPAAWTVLPSDSAGVVLWSVRSLDRDSCVARLGALAPFMVRVLPGPDDATGVLRPEPFVLEDGGMHLGYAVQWFGIALVIVAGAWALARRAAARA
jgi:cytochrome oxidase assembly protein ShyY1